jgi:hypothetical protein
VLLERASDELDRLRRIAGNDRRTHQATEQLLDQLDVLGRDLRLIARGRTR